MASGLPKRWEPLPKIRYGFVAHPFVPAEHSPQLSERQQDDPTALALASVESHLIDLEVGDEVYVFEQLGHTDVLWYRGYVVSTNRVSTSTISLNNLSDYSTLPSATGSAVAAASVEEPQVYVGIFPASHVHIREQLDDAQLRMAEIYERAKEAGAIGGMPSFRPPQKSHMETLPEEDESQSNPASPQQSPVIFEGATPAAPARVTFDPHQQIFVLSDAPDVPKPAPPLPSLKCGDVTASGTTEPLVDEISCALREWNSLIYTYLIQRNYTLFQTVRHHIEVLHAARKQLLAQTLSAEEVSKLRRECVARLVKGNVVQGLDVIVRHPGRGGLVDVNFTGKESDVESWVSGIKLYALQVALAYVDQNEDGTTTAALIDSSANNAFGIISPSTSGAGILAGLTSTTSTTKLRRQNSITLSRNSLLPPSASSYSQTTDKLAEEKSRVKYFHVFLDVRAFVASPCAPGETAEVYCSLYNKAEARFLTEEYCIVLNHQGVPSKESEGKFGKMRTLFTELSQNDMSDLNIICRIVRNGAMRISSTDQRSSMAPMNQANDAASLHSLDGPEGTLSSSGHAGYRVSRMASDRHFRRPFGCAVLELGQHHQFSTDMATSSPMREHVMPIFVPVNEAAFSTLHQDIIASRIKEFEKSPRAEMLAVNVKVFYGDAATLVRENTSLLGEAPLTARLGFPDVVFPGEERNEAYIKLWSGEFFPSGSKMAGGGSPKNIQVSAEVRTAEGQVLQNVISRGSGEALVTQFDSTVFYHQNSPTWGELFKLVLPHQQMEQCHIFFTFRHRSSREEKSSGGGGMNGTGGTVLGNNSTGGVLSTSSKPFAYAWLPLFEANKAFISDGSHTLLLWRTSRPTSQLGPDVYFKIPPLFPSGRSLADMVPPSLSATVQPLRDNLTLRTFLVSTRFTQNEVLLKLLNWRSALASNLTELQDVLTKFTFVGEVEIVKFLRDIFDALFGIMTSPTNLSGALDDLVFNGLVMVLGIVQDRRFTNFRATLDVYIEHHFNFTTAHVRILSSMSKLLSDPSRGETSKDLRASIKVWSYLFKLIVRGREQQRAARSVTDSVGDHVDAKFKSELEALLRSINRLMSASKPASIVGTQTLALQHFASILPDLNRMFALDEMVAIATSFADSVYVSKGRMAVWKLLHILQLTNSLLFDNHVSRSQLIPSIVRWIRPHLGHYDESSHTTNSDLEAARDSSRIVWMESARLAVTVLAVVLDRLQNSLVELKDRAGSASEIRQEQDNVDYILSTMPRLLQTYKELDSPATIKTLERYRSPSTLASTVPTIFPSTYPFPLIAKHPVGQPAFESGSSSRRHRRRVTSSFLNCGLGEIAAVLIVLVMLSPVKHLASFLDEHLDLEGSERTSKFLQDFSDVTSSILLNEAYPSSWLNCNILAHQMVLKMADPLTALLMRDYIPEPEQSQNFDLDLWRSCLNMLVTLLCSDQLIIEKFKPQRRRAVWRLAGDIRGEGARIFAKLWDSIGWTDREASPSENDPEQLKTGGFQVQFVPSLVEPVLELCLSRHDDMRTCAVRILATMITSEWHLNGDFTVIEAEIIDKLDVLFMTDTKGDDISRAFFIGQLRSLFEKPSVDERLRQQVHACLVSVNRFLDLLLSVRSLPMEEGYEDDRIAGTLKLLGFLRQANRVSAFSTHVLRLVNLHLENLNYIEAALTLKLHADLHSWSMTTFAEPVADLDLPRQSDFARKETLYMLILDYLGRGQAWEISIDICRELAQQYEYRSVNYPRLAEVLQHQASLFQRIATTERIFPAYFKVAYYGLQWPASLQQKIFVCRGFELEKYSAFCERIHQKYPKATIIKNSAEPGEHIRSADAQYLHVTALQPEPDRTKGIFTNPETPPLVRAYYDHNAVNLFSFSRTIHKPTSARTPKTDGTADFTELWVEKTYLRCEDTFPTVLRRSEVADVKVVEISPLENAVHDVESKRDELDMLEKKYVALSRVSKPGKINTNRLSMALNSAVDAPAHSGIPMYKRSFFTPAFISSNPDKEELIMQLRDAIDAQAQVLSRCMALHAHLCPPEMLPFHETLDRFWRFNFADEITRLGLDKQTAAEGSLSHQSSAGAGHGDSDARGHRHEGNGDGVPIFQADDPAVRESVDDHRSQYAVDVNSRLQRVVASPEAKAAVMSPLQKHISTLHRKSANLLVLAQQQQQQQQMQTQQNEAAPPVAVDRFSLRSGKTFTGATADGGDIASTPVPPTPTPGPGASSVSRYELSVHEASSVTPSLKKSIPTLNSNLAVPNNGDAGAGSSIGSSRGNRLSRLIRGSRKNNS
ncbi:Deoxycytidine kinase 1 [Tilletia horrida]|uniref:Deoxycytidine kinase 1 n=1 Tax=Tilletia horrida TaxID=155126 RepID=A0AAN6JRE2_9BASI|nr:Deoxycytidine kinase 1 [Tilletia horrida]KAK0565130.1 Deoxycytidine kinase 1 [Tilletia horrida]